MNKNEHLRSTQTHIQKVNLETKGHRSETKGVN